MTGKQETSLTNAKSDTGSDGKPTNAPSPENFMSTPETFAGALGNITWLASMSADHKSKPISWLENAVFPGVMLKQFKLYFKEKQPVAALFFGLLSDANKSKWEKTGEIPALEHWRGGENIVVFDCIAPFGGREDLVSGFIEKAMNKSA